MTFCIGWTMLANKLSSCKIFNYWIFITSINCPTTDAACLHKRFQPSLCLRTPFVNAFKDSRIDAQKRDLSAQSSLFLKLLGSARFGLNVSWTTKQLGFFVFLIFFLFSGSPSSSTSYLYISHQSPNLRSFQRCYRCVRQTCAVKWCADMTLTILIVVCHSPLMGSQDHSVGTELKTSFISTPVLIVFPLHPIINLIF